MTAPASKTLYLVDVSSFIFRAFFAIRRLTTRSGEPVNAVYGVATMMARLAEEAKPEYLAVAYDSKGGASIRKEIYPEYKANRSAPPDDLIPQFDRIENLIRTMEIHSYRMPGVEADDLIATLTRQWLARDPSHEVVIVTGDKDLMALVNDRVKVWETMNNRHYDAAAVEAKMGVRPDQVRDYLALVGDSSDNIPGVPGVGPKTAAELLKTYGTLDAVLTSAREGKIPGKRGETIKAHEKDALISAQLATLHENIEIETDPKEMAYRFHANDECLALLRELDFKSLADKWAGMRAESAAPAAPAETPASGQAGFDFSPASTPAALPVITGATQAPADAFRTVNTEAGLTKLLEGLDRAKEFGFDVETTSLNPREAELIGVAIAYDPAFANYIPIGHRGTDTPQLPLPMVLDKLRPFLEDPRYKKIGQNLKYDWSVMANQGVRPDGIGADTMVAAYVLDPEGRHNLETLARNYLDYTVTTYEQVCGKGKDQITFDLVPVDLATRYSAEDAWIAGRLWDRLRPKLDEERLMEVFARVDMPLVPILSRMEGEGVCIDEGWLRQLSEDFSRELRGIEAKIAAFTKGPVNLNSPKQLAQLLFEELKLPTQSKTKTGFSTDASVLETLAPLHEVPRLLLEYREIAKLKGTYVDPLPLMRDPRTGRIHGSFHQTVAATGRLSSSDPNLQNIPIRTERGRKIRRAFIPRPGNVFVSADYSQIELRLLAHMSGDADLSGSFLRDEDVHRRTASEIFSVSPETVTDEQRGIAKAINFGLMYGKTAFGLAQELKIPRKEAQEVIDRYFQRYSAVKLFLDRQIIEAREKGWTSTILGRKRYLRDIKSANHAIRQNAERMAMNAPIQGTAADLMKLAMIDLDTKLAERGLGARLILQVHDELVLDTPKSEEAAVRKLVSDVMEGAMKLSVPLKVNSATGGNWMDL